MSSDIAIKVENLSKCYHIYGKPRDRLLQMFFWGRRQYFHEFWALKDVNFNVNRGETVGIIGRNGSGKSTLLQLVSGILNPTSGLIQTQGRIAALLELGTGFNPEFTGRENVYLNGAILGLSPEEMDARYEDIIEFANIGQFVDQPVKTYSSGMIVRLAFAVQAQSSPDIMIIDEALAVGDARFQIKCFDRLNRLKDNGTSILLVTHSSEQIVTHCSRAMLIDGGKVLEEGEPRDVANRYMDLLFGREPGGAISSGPSAGDGATEVPPPAERPLSLTDDVFSCRDGYNPHEYRWGDGSSTILDFRLEAGDTPYPRAVSCGEDVRLQVSIRFHADTIRPILGITIKTREGVTVHGANSETLAVDTLKEMGRAGSVIVVDCSFVCRLAAGDYFISLGVATREGQEVIPHDRRYDAIHLQVRPERRFFGIADLELRMEAEERG